MSDLNARSPVEAELRRIRLVVVSVVVAIVLVVAAVLVTRHLDSQRRQRAEVDRSFDCGVRAFLGESHDSCR